MLHCLDIVLVEGCDGAESLTGANVALSTALTSALLKVILDHVFVVHSKACVLDSSHR